MLPMTAALPLLLFHPEGNFRSGANFYKAFTLKVRVPQSTGLEVSLTPVMRGRRYVR